ncbi:MarR family transcriptional regulator [Lentibacillus cibarius]|uniref:Uncharacterized protein n=1 Tax=Lentibacillus cibarius TaxID=2583219 RepID=A0A5S3QLQ6_9BACI|nr:helix-turn-helix domain-containing protein [Lentibacillus cibarius]TMN22725.1 hypothetical protein FFL34_11920 [Lentibacillus cibarius]
MQESLFISRVQFVEHGQMMEDLKKGNLFATIVWITKSQLLKTTYNKEEIRMSIFNDQLTDLERKILTVLQHNNKKGRIPSLTELQFRLGHSGDEIQEIVNDLIERRWIEVEDGEWIVIRKLF